MPEFYVPTSAGICPGDELWAHHINSNGRTVLSKQTNPDDGHVSKQRMGTAGAYLGGDRLETLNGDFVVAAKSKGFNRVGMVVGRYMPAAVAANGAPVAQPDPEPEYKYKDFFAPPARNHKYNPSTGEWYHQKNDEEE